MPRASELFMGLYVCVGLECEPILHILGKHPIIELHSQPQSGFVSFCILDKVSLCCSACPCFNF